MRFLLFICPGLLFFSQLCAQDGPKKYSNNLPLIVSISFYAVSTPFKRIQNNFKNVGIRIGTEFQLNGKGNLLQSLQLGYYRNRFTGNGLYLNSEFIYRPSIRDNTQLDFRVGPGIMRTFNAMPGLKQGKDGQWFSERSSKTLLQLSGSAGIGHDYTPAGALQISPTIQYEVGALLGYAPDFPVLPFSFIHMGSKFKF
jgi:hypothetical protein